jgi:hypothetical protein
MTNLSVVTYLSQIADFSCLDCDEYDGHICHFRSQIVKKMTDMARIVIYSVVVFTCCIHITIVDEVTPANNFERGDRRQESPKRGRQETE